jgi:CDP-diacylglycerol--glycerol-3-phosphate 3-phosphatidyltransferase
LRVALVPVFAWLLVVREPPMPVLAAVVFAIAAATDGIDGFVARRLDLVSGFGQTLDPIADKLLVGTALVPLAIDDRIPWWAVGIILGREVVVVIMRFALGRTGRALPASSMAKSKTVVQMAAVMLATLRPPGDDWATVVIAGAVGFTIVSGLQYVVDALRGRAGEAWR